MSTTERKGLIVEGHGTLTLIGAWDDETRAILEDGAPADAMWNGGKVVVESRFVPDVVEHVEREYETRGYRRVT